jgi:long-chain acyl-CoA synthetase
MPVPRMHEVERRFGAPLLELWGMTELGGLGTTHPHNVASKLGSIGVPLPMHEARVVHVNDPSRQLPRTEIGELVIRGPSVMDGYFGNPAATGEAIEADGWLHTGDLVYQDDDGYYFVVDRKKEVIITGGYNVYPAEVERVIAEHSAVAMVAVAAAADEYKGQVPKAFVVLRSGVECEEAEIIAHCRTRLASYKTPVAVQFMDDLPKTSTGKLLRRALATSRI